MTTPHVQLEAKLMRRQIQPTAVRLLILDFMIRCGVAVSLSDLEEEFPRSDRTTLWRTLNVFHDHGLVHEIHDESGTRKFALCEDDCHCAYPADMHPHFHCSECSRTYCFSDVRIPEMKLPETFHPTSVNFVINGTCPSCLTA